jgi:cyclopropane-fatty-acyl-phospholipid synthase
MISQTPPLSTEGKGAPVVSVRRSLVLERLFVEKLYQQIGRPAIQIVLWDGTVIGDQGSPIGRAVIHRPQVLRRLLVNSVLSFGEAFAANELTIEGDLIPVLTELNRGLARASTQQFWPSFFSRPLPRTSFAASKRRVYHHYDIGNDFYKLWLDKQLVYTCAYYLNPAATLEEAQTAKLDYVCRKLRLQPGEKVVEAGCGWGALALHMARHYGVTVRAFNLSREQLAYARTRAKEEGLSDRVEFVEDDYRNITGRCDAFVSVGMLEHVGPENYRTLGSMINRILTDQGRGLIHSIGRNSPKPLDPWTVKYIFPGAYAPSLREMMDIFEDSGFAVLDVENLRLHYARTCADWLSRFEASVSQVQEMFDEQFVRMWRLYLASSSATFLSGDLQLFQAVFARSTNNSIPLTREDWYA